MSNPLTILRTLWPTKVRHQLICGVALVHLLLMTFFVIDLVERQRAFLDQESLDQTKSLAETLAVNSSSWVLAADVVGLQEIVSAVRRFPGLRYAMVISPDGEVLAHTDPSRIGSYLADEPSRSLARAGATTRVLHSDPSLLDVAAPIRTGTGKAVGWARIGQGQEQISGSLRIVSRNGVIYTLMAIFIGSGLAFLIGRRLTADLEKLLFVSSQIRNNRHDLRMGTSRTDEVARLGEGLNQMLDAITGAEEALRRSAEEIQDLYNRAPCAYHSLDGEGTFVRVNDTELAWLGYTREEILGKVRFPDLLTPRSLERFRQEFPGYKERGWVRDLEFEMVRKDGTVLPVLLSATAIKTTRGEFVMSRSVMHDMTERKRAEEKLQRLNRELRAISNCNQTLLRAEDEPTLLKELCRIICDDAGYRMAWVGYAEHDEAQTVRAVAWAGVENGYLTTANITWADTERGRGPAGTAIRSGAIAQVQDFATDPRMGPWRESAAQHGFRSSIALPLVDETANTFGAFTVYAAEPNAFTQDEIRLLEELAGDLAFGINALRTRAERKRAEEGLRKLSHAVEQSPVSIVITDLSGRIEYVNPTFTRVTGYSREEVLGGNPRILKSGETPPERYRQLWQTITAGGEWHSELHNRKKNGELFWEAAAISPILDKTGTITHFLAVKEDITDRKRVEEALVRSRQQLELAIEGSGIGLWDWALPGGDTVLNERACAMLGFSLDELSPMSQEVWGKLCHPDDLRKSRELLETHFADRASYYECEERLRHKDGHWVWVLDRGRVTEWDAQGRPIRMTGTHLDITARKRAEERIREQAALLDSANDAIYVRTLDNAVTYWNEGAARLCGWSRSEALGRQITDLLVSDPVAFAVGNAALLEQGSWSGELKAASKTGKELVLFSRWTLLRDEQDRPKEVLAINTDITERKQLEAQFLRAQRMEGIGALAGGIAHDLNNILAPILMTAPLLRETVSDPESRTMLDTMEACAQRGADIIKQLLTFARGKPGARAPLPVRHFLREMEKLIRETFPRNIQPGVNAANDVWPILGDATQIHQALMNLCVNARDAMPEGGKLSLAAANLNLDEKSAAMMQGAKPGAYVRVSVSDSGTGIPAEILDRIFDPFFTTKEIGKGTGLGLPTVLGIVRGHGGIIRVNSQVGRGTTFELYLPALPAATVSSMMKCAPPAPDGAGELVLVVDDEVAVRSIVQRSLQQHGYKVLAAGEGMEALAVFAQHRAEIKAVITDMMMPGMDGPALVQGLRRLEPRLPILGMTGLAERTGVKGLESLELAVVLTKPFVGRELLVALHRVLNPKPALDTGPVD